jgi:hypothetical protein
MTSAEAHAKAVWLAGVREAIGDAVLCDLCPDITPERGVEILMHNCRGLTPERGTKTAMAKGRALADDPQWQENVLAWITAYRTRHPHGPTWRETRQEPSLWPESERSSNVRRWAMNFLAQTSLLDGTTVPFGLRVRDS